MDTIDYPDEKLLPRSVWLSVGQNRALNTIAQREHLSRNEIIRRLVDRLIGETNPLRDHRPPSNADT
jgi:hypothetical protein